MRVTATTVLTLTLACVAGVGGAFALHARSGRVTPVAGAVATDPTPTTGGTPLVPTSVPTLRAPAPTDVAPSTTSAPTSTASPSRTPETTRTTSSPAPSTARPTSAQPRRPTAAPPITSPEWDLSSLLSAKDLQAAGFPAPAPFHRHSGIGQSTFGYCDSMTPFDPAARSFFRMDASFSDGKVRYAGQLTARFETPAAARDAIEQLVRHRSDCRPEYTTSARDWTSTPARRWTVDGDSVVAWTLDSPSLGSEEATLLVRSGSFVSELTLSGGLGAVADLDLTPVAAACGRRLP